MDSFNLNNSGNYNKDKETWLFLEIKNRRETNNKAILQEMGKGNRGNHTNTANSFSIVWNLDSDNGNVGGHHDKLSNTSKVSMVLDRSNFDWFIDNNFIFNGWSLSKI